MDERVFTEEEKAMIRREWNAPGAYPRPTIARLARRLNCSKEDVRRAIGLRTPPQTERQRKEWLQQAMAEGDAFVRLDGSKPEAVGRAGAGRPQKTGPEGPDRPARRSRNAAELTRRAGELRTAGKTLKEIAQALGVSLGTARVYVQQAVGTEADGTGAKRAEQQRLRDAARQAAALKREGLGTTEIARRMGISRNTAYKYAALGEQELREHSGE